MWSIRTHSAVLPIAYIVGVSIWLMWCVLCPTWSGRIYNYDEFNTHQWQRHGAFGLAGVGGATGFDVRSPLWKPPTSSGGLGAVVRWPFQRVNHPYVIEINLVVTIGRIWMGVIVAGFVLTGVCRLVFKSAEGIVLDCAWRVSLSGTVVFLCVLVLNVVSWGTHPGPAASVLLAVGSVVAGITWGIRANRLSIDGVNEVDKCE